MRVLLLGNDENILQSGSDSQKRLIGYGVLAEQLHVLVFSAKQLPLRQIGNVLIYSSNGRGRFTALLKGYFLAKKIIRQNKIDVISTQDPFESALVGWRLKRATRAKLNIQIHGDFFSQNYWRRQRWFNFIRYQEAAFVFKKAESIRAVSGRIKQSLVDRFGISPEKIIVAPIYSDFSSWGVIGPGKRENNGGFVFLMVSRLTKEKNIPLVLRAFAELSKEGDSGSLLLHIVGEGPERKSLETLAVKLGINGKVEFLGWLDRQGLASRYQEADCFLLSSDFEGWGLAVLEAAYFSLPIVMTDVGVCGDIFERQKDVLCSAPRDLKGFLADMRKVLNDENLRQGLGQNAKAALSRLPDKERTLNLYKKAWFVYS
ncbi:MAG: glycosyltransferase family 4 protein [Candidatus Pacebacteria bacterium]|nr:glycosyltransferase family 4 protein [Candidatus Paceibacterota bacterium]